MKTLDSATINSLTASLYRIGMVFITLLSLSFIIAYIGARLYKSRLNMPTRLTCTRVAKGLTCRTIHNRKFALFQGGTRRYV